MLLSVAASTSRIPCSEEQKDKVKRLFATLKSEYDTKDPKFMMRHAPILQGTPCLAQACRMSLSPVNPVGYSFMRPALSFLEFSQCVTQAVSPSGSRQDAKDAAQGRLGRRHGVAAAAAARGREDRGGARAERKSRGVSGLTRRPAPPSAPAALTPPPSPETGRRTSRRTSRFPRPDVFRGGGVETSCEEE